MDSSGEDEVVQRTHPALYRLSDYEIDELFMMVIDELLKPDPDDELLDLVHPLCQEHLRRTNNMNS